MWRVKRVRSFVGFVVLCLATASTVWGRGVSTSQIAGVVRDSSGGVLPGVEVTVLKTDTGLTRTTFTGADGSYTLYVNLGAPSTALNSSTFGKITGAGDPR